MPYMCQMAYLYIVTKVVSQGICSNGIVPHINEGRTPLASIMAVLNANKGLFCPKVGLLLGQQGPTLLLWSGLMKWLQGDHLQIDLCDSSYWKHKDGPERFMSQCICLDFYLLETCRQKIQMTISPQSCTCIKFQSECTYRFCYFLIRLATCLSHFTHVFILQMFSPFEARQGINLKQVSIKQDKRSLPRLVYIIKLNPISM